MTFDPPIVSAQDEEFQLSEMEFEKRKERIRQLIERLEREKEELRNKLMRGEISFYQYYHRVTAIERRIRRLEEKLYGF